MRTAFQIGAFQFTGFQEAATVGTGGWIPWVFLDRRARALAVRRRKEREDKSRREQEEALLQLKRPLVPLRYVARPMPAIEIERVAMSLRLRKPLLDTAAELEDFRELMRMVADLDEVL